MATRTPVAVEDTLDSDPPIRGQNFVCLSFISPEDVITKKEVYFFNKFLSDFSSDTKELFDNLVEKFKDNQELRDMFVNLQSRYDYLFTPEKLQESFTYYKATNSDALEKEYLEKNAFQTTMRGIKVRGVYETLPEAQKRASVLKDVDGKFDVYVASVGCWCPWSPNPEEIQEQEYAETELNTLMKNYKENVTKRQIFHQQRAEELKAKAQAKPQTTDDAGSSDPWMASKSDAA